MLPNLVGLAVAAYAIWLGGMDNKLAALLHRKETGAEIPIYVEVSATFAHFVCVQVVALIYAYICTVLSFDSDPQKNSGWLRFYKAINIAPDVIWPLSLVGYAIGFFLFVYALFVALETAISLFRISTWLQRHKELEDNREK